VCALAVGLKYKAGYDDALDVVGVHAVGGMLGALLIGVFASTAFNEAGADGLLAGGGLSLLGKQAVAVGATLVFSFALSFGILKVVDLVVGLRVTEEEELAGLDVTQHEEVGYAFSEGVGSATPVPTGAAAASERAPSTVRVPQGDLG
jgi:Amt family ammonium transporter